MECLNKPRPSDWSDDAHLDPNVPQIRQLESFAYPTVLRAAEAGVEED